MFHSVTHLVSGSPWSYAVILAVIAGDAVLPLLPGEAVLITGAVLASQGRLSLPLVGLAAALGAFAGDNAAFALGAYGGRPAVRRLFRGRTARGRLARAAEQLRRRGPMIIIAARPLPGARTATTFAAGTLHMPWRRFAPAAAVAGVLWSGWGLTLGVAGGAAFRHSLWQPLALSLGVALVLSVAFEVGRRTRRSDRSGVLSVPWAWRIAAALALATASLVAVAAGAGFSRVGAAFAAIRPAWLLVLVGGQLVTLAGYAVAYRALVDALDHISLGHGLAARLTAVGFGLPSLRGGFALDRRVIERLSAEERTATVGVLALGALEYAALVPLAWACAIVLLIAGTDPSVTLPWVVCVPLGTALAVWAARHPPRGPGRVRDGLRVALEALRRLAGLLTHPRRAAPALVGMGVYWAGDALAMWGALRAFGVRPGFTVLVLGLATGYAATRRTLPLAGAGITGVLMPLAYHWLGVPLAPAVAAVVAYRVVNLAGAVAAALGVHEPVRGLVEHERAEERARSAEDRHPARSGSPTRMVPASRMSARKPPRWTSGRRTGRAA